MKKVAFLVGVICSFSCIWGNSISWSAPVTLSNSSLVNSSDPVVSMDPSGNAAALWIENGFVLARYWSNLTAIWSVNIATLSNSGASSPKVKCDANGNMTAIWVESGGIRSATLAAITANANIWNIATLPISGANATGPILDVNVNNQAVAVWVRNNEIEATTTTSFGNWNPIVNQISTEGVISSNPDVSIGANGTIVAVWHQLLDGDDVVFSNRKKSFEGSWDGAINILPAASPYSHHYPKISVDPQGNADAIWYRYAVTNGIYNGVCVYASAMPFIENSWSSPSQISDIGIRNPAELMAKICTDTNGNKLAIWTMSLDHSHFQIESSGKHYNSNWAEYNTLETNNLYAYQGDISVNQANDVVSAFMGFDGTNAFIRSSETATSNIYNQPFWTPPITISTGANNGFPHVSSGFDGTTIRAVAVWLSSNGTLTGVQAAVGSKIPIDPPMNVTVIQNVNHFGVFDDYYNTITWTASTSPNILEYVIFRNGTLVAQLSPSAISYEDHNNVQNGSITYGIASVANDITQSQIVNVQFP